MDAGERAIEYRGFLLQARMQVCSGTSRIKREDGTWRESEPTVVDGTIIWTVGRKDGDAIKELGLFSNRAAACRWIDERLDQPETEEA